jgi:hypothetical protein
MGTSTDRTHYREVLATLAQRTKAKIPALNGRVEKALKLALLGDVEVHDDDRATVYSSSDPTKRYELSEGTCTCRDWEQAPEHLCAHRLSAGFVRKAQHMLAESIRAADTAADTMAPAPLPEAPVSITLKATLHGHQVLVTLRGTDFASVKVQVEQASVWLRAQAPVQATGEGWCTVHQTQMTLNEKAGRTWYSHKTPQGWCKGK